MTVGATRARQSEADSIIEPNLSLSSLLPRGTKTYEKGGKESTVRLVLQVALTIYRLPYCLPAPLMIYIYAVSRDIFYSLFRINLTTHLPLDKHQYTYKVTYIS